jgi:hypothetical protein
MLTPSPVSGASRFFIAFIPVPGYCDTARITPLYLLN